GGDAVPPGLLADMAEDFPQAQVQVLYGPTEATIICCRQGARGGWSGSPGATPLGRPLDNAAVLLLDRWGDPVPIGVPGEICIAGAGVTRGYLGLPELTAEKFPEIGGRRLYRSGDLARHLPDGHLEFLGRIDHQVKVRGFRIEPGEIEAALAAHPGVREAVVMARDEPSGQQLVAYVVPRDGATPAPEELRASLAARLPEYMVPAFVVILETLTLTPHGKVDRRTLPAPERTTVGTGAAPRTPVEELLAGIWEAVLGLPARTVGLHDNFFTLGGQSLLATQVVSRIRRLTGAEIPVRTLFEQPTVAGTARSIETALRADPAGEEPLGPAPCDEPVPLSFAQERLWFLARLEPESSAYNMTFQVRLQGALDAGALARSLTEVVRRHEVLRTTFSSASGRPVQVVAPPAPVPLSVADLTGLPAVAREPEVRRLTAREADRPFDLERGPLLRVLLARLGAGDHRLILGTHHIASDAWSTGVLFRELAAIYPAFRKGRPSPLPELPVQYADFAAWQRRHFSGERLAAHLAWWREHLGGGELSPLELPTDRPRPPVQDHRGASRALTLTPELSRSIAALGLREGASVFMTLLAAFQLLLGRLSGQEDVVVGTPVASRDRQEIEGLIGLFVNTLALRTRLASNPTFRELLGRVRETALGAYAHHGLPFEKLVEELHPRRDLSRHPLFDVMLNLVSTPREPVEIPGLRLAFEEPSGTGSKFVFTLYVSDLGDRLHLNLVYQRALFTAERAAGLLDQLAFLLEQAVADPARPVFAYSLVTPAARALFPDP
ncbi:MAG TPA: condensation domain-containing protein, partial [Thermoanaerobaculia bacterium]